MNLFTQNIISIAISCFLLLGWNTHTDASQKIPKKDVRYFPTSVKFIGMVGPFDHIQKRMIQFHKKFKNKNDFIKQIFKKIMGSKQHSNINILNSKQMSSHGISKRTRFWIAGLNFQSTERFLGLFSPCRPHLLLSFLKKEANKATIHTVKINGQTFTSIYKQVKVKSSKNPLLSGLTFLASEKKLLFLGWVNRKGESFTVAINRVRKRLMIARRGKKGTTLLSNRNFQKALKHFHKKSQMFLFINKILLQQVEIANWKHLVAKMLRETPPSPLRNAFKQNTKRHNLGFKWALAELSVLESKIAFKMHLAISPKHKDFSLLKSVLRTKSPSSRLMRRIDLSKIIGIAKWIFNLEKFYNFYTKRLKVEEKGGKLKQTIKMFHQKSKIHLIEDVLPQLIGHMKFELYKQTSRKKKKKKTNQSIGNTINGTLCIQIKSNKKFKALLKKMVASLRINQAVEQKKLLGSNVYSTPIGKNETVYFGLIKQNFVIALNINSFRQLVYLKKKRQRTTLTLKQALPSKHRGLIYLHLQPLIQTISILPLSQQLKMINTLRYFEGFQGIYAGYTIFYQGISLDAGIEW